MFTNSIGTSSDLDVTRNRTIPKVTQTPDMFTIERRCSVVVSTSAWHVGVQFSDQPWLSLDIRDYVSLVENGSSEVGALTASKLGKVR